MMDTLFFIALFVAVITLFFQLSRRPSWTCRHCGGSDIEEQIVFAGFATGGHVYACSTCGVNVSVEPRRIVCECAECWPQSRSENQGQ